MARWAVCWLFLIVSATVVVYSWSSSLAASSSLDDTGYAMQALGDLGSPVCSRATRALVAAGDGASAEATPEQQATWNRAAQAVLAACGQV